MKLLTKMAAVFLMFSCILVDSVAILIAYPGKSFIISNTTDGDVACALDTPDRSVCLTLVSSGSRCFERILCAWECQIDPACLEFNVHLNNMTCSLFYEQPKHLQSAADCVHFQVAINSNIQSNMTTFVDFFSQSFNTYVTLAPARDHVKQIVFREFYYSLPTATEEEDTYEFCFFFQIKYI